MTNAPVPDAPRAGGETPMLTDEDFEMLGMLIVVGRVEHAITEKQKASLASKLESLRSALPSLLERRRDGERPIVAYLVEYKDGSGVLVKAGQPWPDRWPIP